MAAKATDEFQYTEEWDQEQRAKLDALLSDYAAKRKTQKPSLAALLGQYEPLGGHPGYYGRAPKLRQQIEITRLSEDAREDATAADNVEAVAKMTRLAIFKSVGEEMKQVTIDEFLDEFTAEEAADFLSKYLGMNAEVKPADGAEGANDPNA